MSLHEIIKQKLLQEPFDNDALKLARAIYNTYLENDKELFMDIKINTVLNLLKLQSSKEALKYIRFLFEELNEPLCVKNFKYYANTYPMRFVVFCSYKIKDETIEIELNEEFLHVEEHYMLDPFLKG
ncbi:hypothetical protein SMGD1_1731 [Sulfurimonas gotlandica GD1]|jgi:hypothetical protein|uniref:Uncharacterized protein n=1 Tax=Sulfurimonas gotlandica (strain DSM 19862 / JCM 16533 / GD1) TaxID=929558 RepID=B6BIA4_SULGG|nr:hypothetical protein [Sulfurimonas gotlandica]EDZ63334.1 hypothetical protein CBGD1_954 [Sulfurimonas gotlandica GD1]EHP30254.1 hypothetical protein SMGD1_1731 [Sulfurimonas gotlandica GD1]